MTEEISKQLKHLCDIDPESGVVLAFETFIDQIPIIGKIITTHKIHKLTKGLSRNSDQLERLSTKVEGIDDVNFSELLKIFLFPHVLTEMLEEDEESKIAYFLDGFEQVVDNVIKDKSKILLYYDVLKELRFIEIEYLITLSTPYKVFLMDNEPEQEKDIGSRLSNYFKSEEFIKFKTVIENKLERLGLLNTGRLISFKEIITRMDEESKLPNYFETDSLKSKHPLIDLDDVPDVTDFGNDFLEFFYLLDRYKDE